MHLYLITDSITVHTPACFPAFNGKCQAAGQPHNYANTVCFFIYYIYFLMCSQNYLLTYLLNQSIIPWGGVLLEKLTIYQFFKEFPAHYVAQIFDNTFKNARYLFISPARTIQSMFPISLSEDPS